jgi:hypothetical protein
MQPPMLVSPPPMPPAPLPPPPAIAVRPPVLPALPLVAAMPAAAMPAPPMLSPSPGSYQPWGPAPQAPVGAPPAMQSMYDRRPPGPVRRPSVSSVSSPHRFGRSRASLRPWMLVLGALIMALLAFAVTRACIHTATRPAAPAVK